jgi:hypothetical protein
MPSLFRRLLVALARRRAVHLFAEFRHKASRVAQVQQAALRDKIRRNADSDFGRDRRFDRIHDIATFRQQLAVADYRAFAPYIERVKAGESRALFGSGQRARMFARTSGTTGAAKFIPVTDAYLDEYRRAWLLWGLGAFQAHPRILDGKIVSLVGDWDEFRTTAGIPCGNVSGLVRSSQPYVARARYCLPDCTMRVRDVRAKYYLTLRLALAERSVSVAAAANPATLIGMATLGNEQKERLVRDLADGTFSPPGPVPVSVCDELRRPMRRHPERARQLEQIIARTGQLLPRDFWPDLTLIGNWTGGTMGAYLRQFPALFGDVAVRDIGLIASEGRMTIPLEDGTPAGVLDIASHFYEFIPEQEAEAARPTVLLAHELQEGASYFLLITTSSGLYRYNTSDVVRCVGHWGEAPLLEFLHKGSHCCSLAGEKLTEFQVADSVRRALDDLDMALGEYTLAPYWDNPPYYVLLLEQNNVAAANEAQSLARRVERHLNALNIEYRSKRETLRLGPVQLRVVPSGTWAAFDEQRRRKAGGSSEQYKHPCLVPDLDFVQQLKATEPAALAS